MIKRASSDAADSKGGSSSHVDEELEQLKRLRHENIVHLLGYRLSPQKDELKLAFSMYPRTLESQLRDRELPLPQQSAWEFAKQLAAGVSYLHAQGIAHCDLCPRNVLVRSLQLFVAHFGA